MFQGFHNERDKPSSLKRLCQVDVRGTCFHIFRIPVRQIGFEILTILTQLRVDHGHHLRVDKRIYSIFVVCNSFKIAGCQSSETRIGQRDRVGK